MAPKTPVCPKCSGTMVRGLIADHAHYGMPMVPLWLAGETSKGFLGGDKMPKGLKVQVVTWRCDSCGYLESYATGARKR